MAACQPEIKNDIETVDYLFKSNEFNVEIGIYGCFGARTDKYKMKKVANGYLFYSKKYEFKKLIQSREIDSLKQFLNDLVKTDMTYLDLCTQTRVFRANTFSKGIEFTDRDCDEKWDLLQRVLDYQNVWKLEN